MRNGRILKIFLLLSLMGFSCSEVSAQANIFRVNVLHKFSGWAYMVGDTVIGLHKDNIYTLDTNGVVYVEAIGLSQLDNVRVYQDGKEITGSGARLMYSFKLTFPQDRRADIEIPVYYFYVLNEKESAFPEEYWRSEDNTEPLLLKETVRRQQLIDAGIIQLK